MPTHVLEMRVVREAANRAREVFERALARVLHRFEAITEVRVAQLGRLIIEKLFSSAGMGALGDPKRSKKRRVRVGSNSQVSRTSI